RGPVATATFARSGNAPNGHTRMLSIACKQLDRLVDIAEQRLAGRADGADADPVAGLEEGRAGAAIFRLFGGAGLGDAGETDAVALDGQGFVMRVGNGAAPDDGAC